jgi:threonine/homoserine/homoserine lactone efflux protein
LQDVVHPAMAINDHVFEVIAIAITALFFYIGYSAPLTRKQAEARRERAKSEGRKRLRDHLKGVALFFIIFYLLYWIGKLAR